MNAKKILKLKFYSHDLNRETTIKEFFKTLIVKVWAEQGQFDGKRPWGFSHWERDMVACLEKHKVVKPISDKNGLIERNLQERNKIIQSLIEAM